MILQHEQKQKHGDWKWVCLPKGENGKGDDEEDEGGAVGRLGSPWLGLGSLHNGGEVMEEEKRESREEEEMEKWGKES